jgi:hypothetical protein
MYGKSNWALGAIPPTAAGSLVGWLVFRHETWGTLAVLSLAAISGLFGLAVVAIIEREQTKRAGIQFKVEHLLAETEAEERKRIVRARTRRTNRLASGEQYASGNTTSIPEVMRVARERESACSSDSSENGGPGPESSAERSNTLDGLADKPGTCANPHDALNGGTRPFPPVLPDVPPTSGAQ